MHINKFFFIILLGISTPNINAFKIPSCFSSQQELHTPTVITQEAYTALANTKSKELKGTDQEHAEHIKPAEKALKEYLAAMSKLDVVSQTLLFVNTLFDRQDNNTFGRIIASLNAPNILLDQQGMSDSTKVEYFIKGANNESFKTISTVDYATIQQEQKIWQDITNIINKYKATIYQGYSILPVEQEEALKQEILTVLNTSCSCDELQALKTLIESYSSLYDFSAKFNFNINNPILKTLETYHFELFQATTNLNKILAEREQAIREAEKTNTNCDTLHDMNKHTKQTLEHTQLQYPILNQKLLSDKKLFTAGMKDETNAMKVGSSTIVKHSNYNIYCKLSTAMDKSKITSELAKTINFNHAKDGYYLTLEEICAHDILNPIFTWQNINRQFEQKIIEKQNSSVLPKVQEDAAKHKANKPSLLELINTMQAMFQIHYQKVMSLNNITLSDYFWEAMYYKLGQISKTNPQLTQDNIRSMSSQEVMNKIKEYTQITTEDIQHLKTHPNSLNVLLKALIMEHATHDNAPDLLNINTNELSDPLRKIKNVHNKVNDPQVRMLADLILLSKYNQLSEQYATLGLQEKIISSVEPIHTADTQSMHTKIDHNISQLSELTIPIPSPHLTEPINVNKSNSANYIASLAQAVYDAEPILDTTQFSQQEKLEYIVTHHQAVWAAQAKLLSAKGLNNTEIAQHKKIFDNFITLQTKTQARMQSLSEIIKSYKIGEKILGSMIHILFALALSDYPFIQQMGATWGCIKVG